MLDMSKTPRTKAVHEASVALGYGAMVRVPEGHPPSDPWRLARDLELEIQQHLKNQAELWEHIQDIKVLIEKMRERLLC